mmetsp:Transcript_50639/g.126996  ORF Transcript_50639/g.126996 Transcript_50639/m.126996 type:complete len:96 (-) Transcript_50639:91-378(-)
MDNTQLTTQIVAKVSRQLAAVSDMLAELAHTIDTAIALTTHTHTQLRERPQTCPMAALCVCVQVRQLSLDSIPPELMSIVIAASDVTTIGSHGTV